MLHLEDFSYLCSCPSEAFVQQLCLDYQKHCKHLFLLRESWLQNKVFFLALADIQCLFCHLLGIIKRLNYFSSPVTMSESLPVPALSNTFLSRCDSLSLLFITQPVWYPLGTDVCHIEMIIKYCGVTAIGYGKES